MENGGQAAPWRDLIHELAAFERPSASEGERRAAETIAARLRALGCRVEIEEEPSHGGYWWPLGLANLLGLAGAAMPRRGVMRLAGGLLAGLASAAIWDDVGGGRLWFRRALLPHRKTWNVVAETGPRDARTVVFIAHHDAAHSGLVFHPALGRIPPRWMPRLHARSGRSLPILYAVWLGPTLAAAGQLLGRSELRRVGAALALGSALAMADIGRRPSVPGANDNLSAVGVLVALAQRLEREPPGNLHVVLLSTGSEESFMEGMQGFMRRHREWLNPDQTEFVCLECLGGPELIVLEGEGMLLMRDYPQSMRERLAAAAARTGVAVTRGLRTVAATDSLVPLRHGYRVGTLASIDYTKLPLNYHWPTDIPQALHWETIEAAIEVCDEFLREAGSQA